MIGVWFSGTGNTKFCVNKFLEECGCGKNSFSIEENGTLEQIKKSQKIVIGYPVQYSNIPKILRDYIIANQKLWRGKKIFIIVTMGLFSGDGAGILARLLKRYGAEIIGGLHLKMPDSIADVKALKRSGKKNKELIVKTEQKIHRAACNLKNGKPPQEGLGPWYHLAGFFGQRLYFSYKTKKYTDKLKIDPAKCIGCGLCETLCPMKNLTVKNGISHAQNRCTMCYRCINKCPKQAITLLGKQVIAQNDIEEYL